MSIRQEVEARLGKPVYTEPFGPAEAQVYSVPGGFAVFYMGTKAFTWSRRVHNSLESAREEITESQKMTGTPEFQSALREVKQYMGQAT